MTKLARLGALSSAFTLVSIHPAAAGPPSAIARSLDAQRIANGIPGGLVLNSAWTTGCVHHLAYDAANGITWTHVEVAGKPGFTKDGQLAAATGDQANTGSFDEGDPYENLPLHLANLLDPGLKEIGAAQAGRRTCVVVTLGTRRAFKKDQLFTYPGDGRAGVATSQDVHNEEPHSPGDMVGLPQGTTTGPTIYVWAESPQTFGQKYSITHASLVGPRGPILFRVVDPAQHAQITLYVRPGTFFLVPIAPLPTEAKISASVTVSFGSKSLTRNWSFTTA